MDLPKVYANTIDKDIKNVQEVYKDGMEKINKNYSFEEIERKINEIFSSRSHVYKSNCLITTSNGEFKEVIVGKTSNNLLTMDGKLIPIKDIIDIKKSIS